MRLVIPQIADIVLFLQQHVILGLQEQPTVK